VSTGVPLVGLHGEDWVVDGNTAVVAAAAADWRLLAGGGVDGGHGGGEEVEHPLAMGWCGESTDCIPWRQW